MANFLVKGRPTLTSMVQARTPERMLQLIEMSHKQGADAFGMQLENFEHRYRTDDVFKTLFKAMDGKPCYVTDYGTILNEQMTFEERAEELLSVAKYGKTLLDITGDMFCKTPYELTMDKTAIQKQMDFINKAHELGAEVLMSSHVLEFRNTKDVMNIVIEHYKRGADIAKIVTHATTLQERSDNFATSVYLQKNAPLPTLFLCGGESCTLHRRVAPLLSESLYLCVPEHDELATPTQPLLTQAKAILDAVFGDFEPR